MHNWRTAWLKLPFSEPIHLGTAFTPVQVEGCTDKMWSYVTIQPKGFEGRASNVLIQGKRERSCILLQAILGILVIQRTALRGVTLVWRSRCTNEYAFMEYAGCGITNGRNNCFLGFFLFFVDYFFVVCFDLDSNTAKLLLNAGKWATSIVCWSWSPRWWSCRVEMGWFGMAPLRSWNELADVSELWYRQKLNLGEKSWE